MCTDVCIDMWTDKFIDTCMDMHIHMYIHMCIGMHIHMYIPMCIGIYRDMCMDIYIDMCIPVDGHRQAQIDMSIDARRLSDIPDGQVYRHVYEQLFRTGVQTCGPINMRASSCVAEGHSISKMAEAIRQCSASSPSSRRCAQT